MKLGILKSRWTPLLIVLAGVIVTIIIAVTGPSAPRRIPQRQARLVEVVPLEAAETQVVVEALGSVQPALEVQLQAQVGGQVIEVSPSLIPGGRVAAGEVLLRIDPREYEFAARQRKSDLAMAEQSLRLEESQQETAQREYELMGEAAGSGDPAMMLREPQIESARSAYDAALAAYEQALLNLDRTAVTAPFNAVVQDRYVDRGGVIGASSAIASLVGTDACWVEAMVPADDVPWIDVPRADGSGGSSARVRQNAVWEEGVWRDGRVLGRTSSLDDQGRMVKVIVEVTDPFSVRRSNAGEPELLVGSFVNVEIFGRTIENAVVVERTHVHDGDTVWLMDDEGALRIRAIDPAYVGEDIVVVTEGLEAGESVVTSYLSAPVEGMPLRVRAEGREGEGREGEGREAEGVTE